MIPALASDVLWLAQQQNLGGGFAALWCVFAVIGLGLTIFWIWALVDCIQRDFGPGNEKIIWVLVIALLNWIGALIYVIIGRPKGTK